MTANKFSSLLILSLVLSACGGGGGGGAVPEVLPPTVQSACSPIVSTGYTGNFESAGAGDGSGDGGGSGGAAAGGGLGKVLGGRMVVTDLASGKAVGEAVTDSVSGLVTIKTCTFSGPFLITMEGRAGATYYDEGLNKMNGFGPGNVLHALVDRWDEHVGVSPLTEAAYRYALNNYKSDPAAIAAGRAPLLESGSVVGLTSAQVVSANKIVLDQINSRNLTIYSVDSIKTLPTPLDATSGAVLKSNANGKSAILNGGLVKAANYYSPLVAAPALNLTNDLARDLTDGQIDGFALDGSGVSQSSAATYDSRMALPLTLGTTSVEAQFSAVAGRELFAVEGFLKSEEEVGGFPAPGGVVNTDQAILLSNGDVRLNRITQTLGEYNTNIPGTQTRFNKFLTDTKQLTIVGDGDRIQKWSLRLAVKTNGEVWTWGPNSLCLTSFETASSQNDFIGRGQSLARLPYKFFDLQNITSVAATSYDYGRIFSNFLLAQNNQLLNVVARDNNGEVWRVGIDVMADVANFPTPRELSDSTMGGCIARPKKLPGLSDIKTVQASGLAQFAIDSKGRVFSWGSGPELGLGKNFREYVNAPTLVQGLSRIVSILIVPGSGVGNGIYALSSDGSWYTWGYSSSGIQTLPVKVVGTKFKSVAANWSGREIVYLKEDGTVEAVNPETNSKSVLAVPKTRYLQATLNEVWIYAQDGRVFVYGKNYPRPTDIAPLNQ